MNLWARAVGRVALYVLAVAAAGTAFLGAAAALLWVLTFYGAYFWIGSFVVFILVSIGVMIKGEHDRLVKEESR